MKLWKFIVENFGKITIVYILLASAGQILSWFVSFNFVLGLHLLTWSWIAMLLFIGFGKRKV